MIVFVGLCMRGNQSIRKNTKPDWPCDQMNIWHADAEYLTRIATVKDESAASASVAVLVPGIE